MWGESSNNCESNCQCQGLIPESFKIKMNTPLVSPSGRIVKRSTKISRIFEERSRFKMANKENELINETFMKLEMEEETRDSFGNYRSCQTRVTNCSMTKLDFKDALQSQNQTQTLKMETASYVPKLETDLDQDFETLHDLEEEFDNENFDHCTKYEIISTDSPDIISRGRPSTARKVNSRNFVFGAPLSENEQSTSFDKTVNATRMLNFEDETFEFTSPAAKKSSFSVKKSLKFNETPSKTFKVTKLDTPTKGCDTPTNSLKALKFSDTPTKAGSKFSGTPTKHSLRHERSNSSIGSMSSMSSLTTLSPCSSRLRLFTSDSTASMESGFISELEEPFLDLEEMSNSPKMANFNELLSGPIKENILTDKNFLKRPSLLRSLSLNPESKAKVSLFSGQEKIQEKSPEKKSQKRVLTDFENVAKKSRLEDNPKRPVLQRAFSENHASIMSALARSANEPDLIGDFSTSYCLPLTLSDHNDLKAVSADTLAALIGGDYQHCVKDYQIIDCRYPYEFEGGHITGALNLHTPAQVESLLNAPLEPAADRRSVLVFHCEYSIERGPKLYRYLRSSDRSKNLENYPQLNYPEIYLLHKGYRSFYQNYPQLCTNGYTAMLDPKHTQLLKRHRSIDGSGQSQLKKNRLLF